MEFDKAVLKRRMVRHYKSISIPAGKLEHILELAIHAPSAGYSQGVAFIVITDPERRKELGIIQGEKDYSNVGFHRWISEAPVGIVICVSELIYHERYREKDKLKEDGTEIDWPTPYWFFDAGCSSMIILLAAVNEGLAGSFTGVFDVPGMKTFLGMPEHFHPVGVISLGYADDDVKSPSLKRGRRPLRDMIHYERW